MGDISDVAGNVQVAGRDINTNVICEAATAARTEKEFEFNELTELKAAIFDKIEYLKAKSTERVESGKSFFYFHALGLNEGEYLVSRDEQLRQLSRRLSSEQSVFISGRGGVGRTSLLQAEYPGRNRLDYLPKETKAYKVPGTSNEIPPGE